MLMLRVAPGVVAMAAEHCFTAPSLSHARGSRCSPVPARKMLRLCDAGDVGTLGSGAGGLRLQRALLASLPAACFAAALAATAARRRSAGTSAVARAASGPARGAGAGDGGASAGRASAPAAPAPAVNDPWRLLGIERGASVDEIRKAFRQAARNGAHPDLGGDIRQFQDLRTAHDAALDVATGVVSPTAYDERSGDGELVPQQPRTLEEFLAFRQREQDRLGEVGRLRRDTGRRPKAAKAVAAQRKGPQEVGRAAMEREKQQMRRVLEEAPGQEAREAWVRELTSERGLPKDVQRERTCLLRELVPEGGFFASGGAGHVGHARSSGSNTVGASTAPASGGDEATAADDQDAEAEVVGYRVVRAAGLYGAEDVRMAVYQRTDGERFYISPLTAKRVTLPR